MPRKKQQSSAARQPVFKPYGDEQRTALHALFTELMGGELRQDVPQWYAEAGRGLVVFAATGPEVSDLQAPVYVSLAEWQQQPLLVNTPHDDLIAAIESYDPTREFVLLTVSPKTPYVGLYTWWRVPFSGLSSPKVHPSRLHGLN
jgi:hypothetical protein